MRISRTCATFAACAMVTTIVACGSNSEPRSTPYGLLSPTSSPSSSAVALPTDSPQPTTTAVTRHVFVVVMENTGLDNAVRSEPIARLASANALATNYHAVARPSLPNYLALTSGNTWGITDDGYHSLPDAADLGAQLTTAGVSWRAYMEGMTADAGCLRSPYPYALKHDPGHDCTLEVAGTWLDGLVSRIESSEAWRSGGTLFIVWDEGNGGDRNLVPLIVLTKDATPMRVETQYDHYSLLATIEDLFHLPRLGAGATATPLTQLIAGGVH
ncbi:MAG: hypothetical protein E6J35_12395 [Chloroflexi bacterium]|nr:MAG: hypothetical protein E6J35_12395 [Chloroflexota bacterium]